jgi:hypothetical protein
MLLGKALSARNLYSGLVVVKETNIARVVVTVFFKVDKIISFIIMMSKCVCL